MSNYFKLVIYKFTIKEKKNYLWEWKLEAYVFFKKIKNDCDNSYMSISTRLFSKYLGDYSSPSPNMTLPLAVRIYFFKEDGQAHKMVTQITMFYLLD